MSTINSCLPEQLPYPALINLVRTIYHPNKDPETGVKLGLVSNNETEKMVERKYMLKLYLSLANLFRSLREIMFCHPMSSMLKDFKERFSFMRQTVLKNLHTMKAFHRHLNGDGPTDEECVLPFEQVPSGNNENEIIKGELAGERCEPYNIRTLDKTPGKCVAMFKNHIALITQKRIGKGDKQWFVTVINTRTKEVEKEFPADNVKCVSDDESFYEVTLL